jgi:hypothetical protein
MYHQTLQWGIAMKTPRVVSYLPAAFCLLALTAPAVPAATITTLFGANNNGTLGGAVFLDVTTAPTSNLIIQGLDLNTSAGGAFTLTVYRTDGGYSGNEMNSGLWTMVATGTGTGAGLNNPSAVTLSNPFGLAANSTYGLALVLSDSAEHQYTNGTGANQNYSNADIALALGAAQNSPFLAGPITPRVWNGSFSYAADPVPEPGTISLLAAGGVLLAVFRRRRKQ